MRMAYRFPQCDSVAPVGIDIQAHAPSHCFGGELYITVKTGRLTKVSEFIVLSLVKTFKPRLSQNASILVLWYALHVCLGLADFIPQSLRISGDN